MLYVKIINENSLDYAPNIDILKKVCILKNKNKV